ncbi:protein LfgN [Vibrio zhanjiangensis]|uniref:Protein LfgN n=1 Tax=Vibrio zhanjiangensis TaxID=1046128 RepID=A0ABQ6EV10_9VIBR|nr:flagellar protein FlgN [Vibrio zhanjiangensis]GLT16395.1 protein LfgN [Vibrio zhanjiangensis]
MSSKTSHLIQSFVNTLVQDIQSYQKLETLLKQQKPLYFTFEVDKLEHNIARQQPLLHQLQQHAHHRSQIMARLKLSADHIGIERLFSALPPPAGEKIRHLWSQLEKLVKCCQALNQENGQTTANFHELVSSLNCSEQHTYTEKPAG